MFLGHIRMHVKYREAILPFEIGDEKVEFKFSSSMKQLAFHDDADLICNDREGSFEFVMVILSKSPMKGEEVDQGEPLTDAVQSLKVSSINSSDEFDGIKKNAEENYEECSSQAHEHSS